MNMTYSGELRRSMEMLAADPKVRVIGYNTRYGRGWDMFKPEQLIEMPVAENLMAGTALGLSLQGFLPLLYFERFDFVLNAMDMLVNHFDKLALLSNGQYLPRIIIRIVVGNCQKPLLTGVTHTQDFTHGLRYFVSFPIVSLLKTQDIFQSYVEACQWPHVTALVEYKDRYE